MSIKQPYRVRPALFAVGFFFLLNANINVVDILPDAVGWGLICFALYGLHDLSYKLEQAIKYSAYLVLLGVARGGVLFTGNVYFDPNNTLLATFVLSLLDLALSLLFASVFFDGLSHLAVRGDSKRVPSECSGARSFTMLFFAAKSVLVVLPELVALAKTDNLMDTSSSVGYYNLLDIQPYFVAIQFVLVTLLGAAWFIIIRQLFKVLKEDKELLDHLANKYISTILADSRLQLRRSLRTGLLFCALGTVSFITLVVDKMNVIPEFLPAALLLVGCYILVKHHQSFGKLRFPAAVLAAVSVLSFAVELVIKETTVNYNFLKAVKDVPLDVIALVLSAALAVAMVWCSLTLYSAVGKLAYSFCLPGAKEDWEKNKTSGLACLYALSALSGAAKIILPNSLWPDSAAVFLLTVSGVGLAIFMSYRIFSARDAVMKGTF